MMQDDSPLYTDDLDTPPDAFALERFYDYYIKESHGDPTSFGKREKIAVGLELLGSSAGIYYWPSAAAYGEGKPTWLKSSLIAGNTVVGTLFLVKATDDLFEAILRESKAPSELRDLVNLPSRSQLISKYLKMLVGSAICSVPFGIATYLFPLPGCDQAPCLATIVTHSTLANIILHAISWNVILTPQYWAYRLPLIPFEKAHAFYKQSRLSPSEKEILAIAEKKEVIYQKYRSHLHRYLDAKALKIVNNHRRNPGGEATIFLKNSKAFDSSLMTMAMVDANESKTSALVPPAKSSSRLWCLCTAAQSAIRSAVGFAGATFMLVGCIGWVADPIYIGLTEGFNAFESVLLGILPAYSMGVLLAFYGEEIFKQIYDYLTSWKGNKFPVEARMYPISFTVFLLVNAYLSIFSYGTAQVLVSTIFDDEMWDAYRPILQALAYPAVPVLSFVPFLNLFTVFVRKATAKFGPESDEKLCCRLLDKATAMSQEILLMEGSHLMRSIQRYTPGQRQLLGIDPQEFEADQQTLANLHGQILLLKSHSIDEPDSSSEQSDFQRSKIYLPFFGRPKPVSDPDSAPLLVNDSSQQYVL